MILHFASAAFLAGALFALLPVFLHLLRKKPSEPSIFPSFEFLHGSVLMKLRKNSLRKWIVLLLRILFVILICLAFAWPYFASNMQKLETSTVLLFDNSFSMTATTCKDELAEKAENIIKSADEKNPVVVGTISGNSVIWLNDFKSFKPDLLDNFRTAKNPFYGTNSFHDVFRLAALKLKESDAGEKKIILVSDGHRVPWEKVDLSQKLPPGIGLDFIRSENAIPENICIEDVENITVTGKSGKTILKITLHNYSTREMNGVLALNIVGSDLAKEPVSIPAGSSVEKVISIPTPSTLPVPGVAELKIIDDIKIDNKFFFSIDKQESGSTLVLAPPGRNIDYVSLALMAESRNGIPNGGRLDENTDFIVVQDIASLDPKDCNTLEAFVKDGGSLAFVYTEGNAAKEFLKRFGVKVIKSLSSKKALRFSSFDFSHPVMKKFVDCGLAGWFEALFFRRAELDLPVDARIIASFGDGAPAIAEISYGGGRLVLFCMDFTRKNSTWPVKHTFLPFWQELAKYCRKGGNKKKEIFYVGDRIMLKSGEKLSCYGEKPFEKTPALFNAPGSYLISSDGREKMISVNVPAAESNTIWLAADFDKWKSFRQEGELEIEKKDLAEENPGKENSIPPAYFFALAFLVGLCELALSNRTAL